VNIALSELAKITAKAYQKANYPKEQIPVIVDILSYAQYRGNMQSVLQIITGIPPYQALAPIQWVKKTNLSCLLDGHNHIGLWVMYQAMQKILEKAKKHGFCIVGSFNSAPPGTAALGYYVKKIAETGLIAFAFSGSSKKVAPLGGYQALLGSNPIAVGLPCDESPIIIDMATAIMPVFKVLQAQLHHQLLPEGVAFDREGHSTRDPNAVLKEGGALTVSGSNAKGYSLSLLVEALTGPLVGAAFATVGDTKYNWGNLIYAFDPELLIGREPFMKEMTKLRKAIKTSQCLPEIKEIFLPGEMAERGAAQALLQGWIEIEDELLANLKNSPAY
jgi:L-2-hydroxycarboxylate dehydrogenase (NAD+)